MVFVGMVLLQHVHAQKVDTVDVKKDNYEYLDDIAYKNRIQAIESRIISCPKAVSLTNFPIRNPIQRANYPTFVYYNKAMGM